MSTKNVPTISFEFFPPKTVDSEKQLWETAAELATLGPQYMTVTYGAGGSTRDKTLEITSRMAGENDMPIASHLTFLSTTKDDLENYIDKLWDNNVRNIVALRGDLPKGKTYDDFTGDDYFDYTSNFVSWLKSRHPFDVSVGAYPEKHPDAPSLDADIEALRLKCDAGADRAITQFFFGNDCYFDFLEKCRTKGITTPIYPGLVPIYDFTGLQRFAKNCQAHVPDWLHEKFAGLEDKPDEAYKLAEELLCKQVEELVQNGVEHIHFYTLNKAPLTKSACITNGLAV